MAPRKKAVEGRQPRELTAQDREHIAALHERFGAALSLDQITANYGMSLGLPDAAGRVPSAREQLGAVRLFADLSIPRPKASDTPGERAVLVFRNPFCTCPPCTCGAEDPEK